MSDQTTLFEVLFVDDEPRVLDGLRRQLRPQRGRWTMRFAQSGHEAVEMMRERPADVLVTDMRMPGMSGARLCEQVRNDWPHTVRYILSGQTDQFDLLADIGSVHQFLQKPCSPENLDQAISRAQGVRGIGSSMGIRRTVAGLIVMPCLTHNLSNLITLLEDDASDIESVAQAINQDVGISAKMMQLVNSAFFGMPRATTSVEDAVCQLGLPNLRDLVVEMRIFDRDINDLRNQHVVESLWASSIAIGCRAYELAIGAGMPESVATSARHAGYFSHLGRAVIADSMPDVFTEILKLHEDAGCEIRRAELELLGAKQSTIGGYALGIWGFSDLIVDSVLYQAKPSDSGVTSQEHPLYWLHLARSMQAHSAYTESVVFDDQWARSIGVDHDGLSGTRRAA